MSAIPQVKQTTLNACISFNLCYVPGILLSIKPLYIICLREGAADQVLREDQGLNLVGKNGPNKVYHRVSGMSRWHIERLDGNVPV